MSDIEEFNRGWESGTKVGYAERVALGEELTATKKLLVSAMHAANVNLGTSDASPDALLADARQACAKLVATQVRIVMALDLLDESKWSEEEILATIARLRSGSVCPSSSSSSDDECIREVIADLATDNAVDAVETAIRRAYRYGKINGDKLCARCDREVMHPDTDKESASDPDDMSVNDKWPRASETCPECGKPAGSNLTCPSCTNVRYAKRTGEVRQTSQENQKVLKPVNEMCGCSWEGMGDVYCDDERAVETLSPCMLHQRWAERRSEAAKSDLTKMAEAIDADGPLPTGMLASADAQPDNVPCVRCRWPQVNHPITERREGDLVHVMHHIVCPVHEGWIPPGTPVTNLGEAIQALGEQMISDERNRERANPKTSGSPISASRVTSEERAAADGPSSGNQPGLVEPSGSASATIPEFPPSWEREIPLRSGPNAGVTCNRCGGDGWLRCANADCLVCMADNYCEDSMRCPNGCATLRARSGPSSCPAVLCPCGAFAKRTFGGFCSETCTKAGRDPDVDAMASNFLSDFQTVYTERGESGYDLGVADIAMLIHQVRRSEEARLEEMRELLRLANQKLFFLRGQVIEECAKAIEDDALRRKDPLDRVYQKTYAAVVRALVKP